MNVINFSGGEPEIEPSRDIVALALDAAAAAGVVPVIAAGNDYNDFGAGSVSSPGNSEGAITVGAVEIGGSPARRTHADFSSVGPTDDLAAPEAGRCGTGRRRPVVGLGGRLDGPLGDEHGGAARRRRGGAAAPAASGLDGRTDQVRARAVGHRLRRRAATPGRPEVAGRRRRRASARRPAAALRRRPRRCRSGFSPAARRPRERSDSRTPEAAPGHGRSSASFVTPRRDCGSRCLRR